MARFIFVPDDIPALSDARMKKAAEDFFDFYTYWGDARKDLIVQWDENTRAYNCRRRLPEIDGLPYINPESPWGPSDIRDSLNNWATKMGLAMFPKDDSWMSVIGRSGEEPAVINAVKSHQLWVNRKAKTRQNWVRHLKQCALLGFSPMYLSWHQKTVMRPVATKDQAAKLKIYARQQGVDPAQIKNFHKAKEAVITFNGPVVRPLNSRDVRVDPEADLQYDDKPAYCIETYRRPSDLAAEMDNDKCVYSNLDKLQTINASEVYHENTEMSGRLKHQNDLGVYPQNYADANTKLVKVLIFYFPYFQTREGLEFYDTYFHVGVNGEKSTDAHMIRVEESPTTETGARHLIMETFIDWFTGHPYGISAVEHLVSVYDRKAFMDELQLAAAAASAFPAVLMGSGVLKDDILDRTPAAINEVAQSALGQQFVTNVPTIQNAAEFGLVQMRWYGQEISDSFGNIGGDTANDPTRSVSSRETATAAKIKASGNSITIDEQTEKFSNTQQEAQQWILDMGREMLADSTEQQEDPATGATQDVLRFGAIKGNNAIPGEIVFDQYDQPRWIECLGLHGAMNKGQMIQDKTQFLQIIGQNGQAMPNLPALQEKVVKSIASDLNIELEDMDWMSPMDIAAANPQVQMQALMDGLDNPQMMAAAMQQKQAEMTAQQQPPMPGQAPATPQQM